DWQAHARSVARSLSVPTAWCATDLGSGVGRCNGPAPFPSRRRSAMIGDSINPGTRSGSMSEISVLGIDIAKNVFELCGLDERGAIVVRKCVKRARFFETVL